MLPCEPVHPKIKILQPGLIFTLNRLESFKAVDGSDVEGFGWSVRHHQNLTEKTVERKQCTYIYIYIILRMLPVSPIHINKDSFLNETRVVKSSLWVPCLRLTNAERLAELQVRLAGFRILRKA